MEQTQPTQNVTSLLLDFEKGDRNALEKLLPHVYAELKRIATRYMRKEREGHTLQSTALVHEAYMKLVDQNSVKWQNRAHFFGVAAQIMRRILIDHARVKKAVKRGGNQIRLSFDERLHWGQAGSPDLLALDQAMKRLEKIDERQSRVVELRYFGGLSIEETAQVLKTSPATVKRDWTMAKAWLHRELSKGSTAEA